MSTRCEHVLWGRDFLPCPKLPNGDILPAMEIADLGKGTEPISDILWTCGRTGKVIQILAEVWSSCCAPVTLLGGVVLFETEEMLGEPRVKKKGQGKGDRLNHLNPLK